LATDLPQANEGVNNYLVKLVLWKKFVVSLKYKENKKEDSFIYIFSFLDRTDISTTMRYAHLEHREVSSRARDVINQLNIDANKPSLKVV
jgi:hypothetical protein